MAKMMDAMLQVRDNIGGLDVATDRIMDDNGCFDGKDVTQYIEAYKTRMRKKGIPMVRQVASVLRIVTSSLYTQVVELQEANPECLFK